jgi:hypothetical protein
MYLDICICRPNLSKLIAKAMTIFLLEQKDYDVTE